MHHPLLSPSIGRRVAVVGLAAMALSVAACQDGTTAPTSSGAREVAGPNNVTVVGGVPQVATFISLHIVDVAFKTVPEKAWVRFRWSNPTDSADVADNGPLDLDPTIGYVKFAAPTAAGYQGCVRMFTTHYVTVTGDASYPTCNSKSWLSTNIQLGEVFMRRRPQIAVRMEDLLANLLPGASLHVCNSQNGWSLDIADGSGWDEPPVNDGKITVTLPLPGYYLFNEGKKPTGPWEQVGTTYYGYSAAWDTRRDQVIQHQAVAY